MFLRLKQARAQRAKEIEARVKKSIFLSKVESICDMPKTPITKFRVTKQDQPESARIPGSRLTKNPPMMRSPIPKAVPIAHLTLPLRSPKVKIDQPQNGLKLNPAIKPKRYLPTRNQGSPRDLTGWRQPSQDKHPDSIQKLSSPPNSQQQSLTNLRLHLGIQTNRSTSYLKGLRPVLGTSSLSRFRGVQMRSPNK